MDAGSIPGDSADRTALISAKLKAIYRKAVLPVEKRYRYDYFFESPLLTDVEFDGELVTWVFVLFRSFCFCCF